MTVIYGADPLVARAPARDVRAARLTDAAVDHELDAPKKGYEESENAQLRRSDL